MLKKNIILLSTVVFSTVVYSQEATTEGAPVYHQTISKRSGQPQVVHDRSYYEKSIVELKENLVAIETKITFVQSNAEEHQNALKIGWYDQMEKNKKAINENIKIIENKLIHLK